MDEIQFTRSTSLLFVLQLNFVIMGSVVVNSRLLGTARPQCNVPFYRPAKCVELRYIVYL